MGRLHPRTEVGWDWYGAPDPLHCARQTVNISAVRDGGFLAHDV